MSDDESSEITSKNTRKSHGKTIVIIIATIIILILICVIIYLTFFKKPIEEIPKEICLAYPSEFPEYKHEIGINSFRIIDPNILLYSNFPSGETRDKYANCIIQKCHLNLK